MLFYSFRYHDKAGNGSNVPVVEYNFQFPVAINYSTGALFTIFLRMYTWIASHTESFTLTVLGNRYMRLPGRGTTKNITLSD